MRSFIASRRIIISALTPLVALLAFWWANSTPRVIAQGPPACIPPPSGMVSWWPWDGNAIDIQGGNSTLLFGNPSFTGGKVSQALQFDGVDDYARITASASLNVGMGNGLTIDVWIKPSDVSSSRPLLEWDAPLGVHLWTSVFGSANLYANIVDTSGVFHTIGSASGIVTANTWQHVALTYDKQTGLATLYRDGAVVAQQNLGIFTPRTNTDLYIGKRTFLGNEIYVGLMDEVELFNRALSQAEIQAIVTAGSAGKCKNTVPATICNNVWETTTTIGAPAGRTLHKAVWTGTEMIVWGGQGSGPHPDFPNTGGRYNPATDGWTATSTIGAPAGRRYLTAVWTGTEMIVWGGQDSSFSDTNTGGRYNPATDTWTPTSTTNAPAARQYHTAIWTGTEMIVWGGQGGGGHTGGRYNPATDTWTPTSTTNAAAARFVHTAVWTGTEMIVWGGVGGSGHINTGGRYNPANDSWIATTMTNAPAGREQHTAVWTGNEMIVWGGLSPSGRFDSGGRYNPTSDSWIATSTTSAPSARQLHTGVWTGTEMTVWGGGDSSFASLSTGGRYNPTTDSWMTTSNLGAPAGRAHHTAVWTNAEMIVWGGGNEFNTGGRYCGRSSNTAPVARCQNVTVSGPSCEANASIDDGSFDPDGDPLTLTQSPAGPYPVGTTDVMLTVTDGKGGSSSCSATVTVVDNTGPVIPSLPSIIRTSDPGVCSAVVLLRQPRVGDNCGVASVSNNAPASNVFLVGTTTVTWTATDVNGNSNTATQTVTVTNPAPVVTMTGPPTGSVYAVNTPVSFTGSFADNPGDTHTATWMFDNLTSAGTVNETTGEITGSFSFTTAGIYKVTLTVTDGCGGTGSASTINELDLLVVIYDPGAGFVTGGGWINSPAGAYVPNPSLTGKANFGFVSRYHQGATVPTGNTEFQFKAGSLNFHSTSYEWLVIAGKKAQYKGSGKINGTGDYDFMLTAIDGQQPGGGGSDKFRIRIWDRNNGGLIYDNQLNAANSDDPTTLLGGGSIVIHK